MSPTKDRDRKSPSMKTDNKGIWFISEGQQKLLWGSNIQSELALTSWRGQERIFLAYAKEAAWRVQGN